jgi:WD40 repeat protein
LQVLSGEMIASGSGDHLIKIWNLKTGKCLNTLYGHAGYVNCLQVPSNNNSHVLVSGSSDKTIKVWNFKSGIIHFTLRDHWKEIKCIKYISNDVLASGSADHTIKIWNLKIGQLVSMISDKFTWGILNMIA